MDIELSLTGDASLASELRDRLLDAYLELKSSTSEVSLSKQVEGLADKYNIDRIGLKYFTIGLAVGLADGMDDTGKSLT